MRKQKIIGVDCDDVVINLVPNWLKFYNEEWNDNLTINDIKSWNIAEFVKYECGSKIFEYIHPINKRDFNIYNFCEPIEGSLAGIRLLENLGHRVVFVTASNKMETKYNWLMLNNFLLSRKDFIQAYDKSLIRLDYLIDDRFENIEDIISSNNNSKGILYSKPWNEKFPNTNSKKQYYRKNSWTEIMAYFDTEHRMELYDR